MITRARPAHLAAMVLTVIVTFACLSCSGSSGVGVGVGYGSRWGGGSGTPPVFVGSPGF